MPFTLVSACELSPVHRRAHEANHPGLARFPRDVFSPEYLADIPEHDLHMAGFPCVDYSALKRKVTIPDLNEGLRRFDRLIELLAQALPPVVILENVASLLHSHLDWVVEHIMTALSRLGGGRYAIFRSVLCSSSFKGRFLRPRVVLLLYLT